MFSYLWIVAGTLVYGIVATGIFLKLRAARSAVLPFLMLAVIAYIPFVGYPFLTAAVRSDDDDRRAAAYRIEVTKKEQGIVDTAIGAAKEDRYLNAAELNRMVGAISDFLAQPTAVARSVGLGPHLCTYLYLYAWFLDHPSLTLDQKWNAALYMPRPFYSERGRLPLDPPANYDRLEHEVVMSWQTLRRSAVSPVGLSRCSDPS